MLPPERTGHEPNALLFQSYHVDGSVGDRWVVKVLFYFFEGDEHYAVPAAEAKEDGVEALEEGLDAALIVDLPPDVEVAERLRRVSQVHRSRLDGVGW